jgi:hypothetical protein
MEASFGGLIIEHMKIDVLKNYPSMNGIEGLFVVDFKIRAFGV